MAWSSVSSEEVQRTPKRGRPGWSQARSPRGTTAEHGAKRERRERREAGQGLEPGVDSRETVTSPQRWGLGRWCRPLGMGFGSEACGVREARAAGGGLGGSRVAPRAHFPGPGPCQEGLTYTAKAQKRARRPEQPGQGAAPTEARRAHSLNTCRTTSVANTIPR